MAVITALTVSLVAGACSGNGGDLESFCAALAAVPTPLDEQAVARDGDDDNVGAVVLRLKDMADRAPGAIAADAKVLARIGERYTDLVRRQATGQTVTEAELAEFNLELVTYGEAVQSLGTFAHQECGLDLSTR